MKPEDLALFDTPADAKTADWDDWSEPTPKVVPAKPLGRLNFTDESTTPDAELKAQQAINADAERAASQKRAADLLGVPVEAVKPGNEAMLAAVLPLDAPKNDPDYPPPAKATRGKGKVKKEEPHPLTAEGFTPTTRAAAEHRAATTVVEFGPESRALLQAILAKLG